MVFGPLGERFGRGLQVGLVDRDPAPAGADQRARLLGELADLGRGQLDVVEHRRPAHVGELVGADRGLRRLSTNTRSDGVALRRDSSGTRTSKPAAASRGPVDGHQLPRLVLAEDDLAAPVGRRRAAARAACARAGRARLRGRRASSGRRRWRARRLEHLAALGRRCATWRRTPRGATRRCGRAGRAARSSARVLARDRARPLLERAHELAGDARPARRTRCRRGGRGTLR